MARARADELELVTPAAKTTSARSKREAEATREALEVRGLRQKLAAAHLELTKVAKKPAYYGAESDEDFNGLLGMIEAYAISVTETAAQEPETVHKRLPKRKAAAANTDDAPSPKRRLTPHHRGKFERQVDSNIPPSSRPDTRARALPS